MGTLRSKTYTADTTVNGVLLGQPTIVNGAGDPFGPGDAIDDLWFGWNHENLPTGVRAADGTITVDNPGPGE